MARKTKLTPLRRKRFIQALSEQPNVSRACRCIGVSRRSAYDWYRDNPKFKEDWDEALKESTERLVEEAWRRGHDGFDEPVFYQGEKVATQKRYSDHLLMRLLEAHDPRFARKQEVTGKDGEPLAAGTVIILPPEDPLPK